ncbi:amidase [Zavarzinia sp. CC-PAN008]|uniref:amidase n=1 Tax=Zavarzinia sp. CC-PAN008 TaxID=3243332 RepID=UPI003F7459AF
MTLDDLCCGTISDVAPLIASGALSPVELTAAMLQRIERIDPTLHAYVHVDPASALRAAEAAQSRIRAGGYRGPLDGVPLGIKDIFDTAAMPTESGSAVLRGRIPPNNAHVVDRLEDAGAINLGKQATAEFAFMGYPPSVAPAPVNPWAADRTPGMSSGGSAVAVAAALCFGALGSDTGGSIRFPSAVNGIVGLKPTFGRVSRRGVHPFSATLDHVGPFARSVADVALLYQAIAGHDAGDPFSAAAPVGEPLATIGDGVRGLRLGFDLRYVETYAEAEVVQATLAALSRLEQAGMVVVEVDLLGIPEVCHHWLAVGGSEALLAYGRERFHQTADQFGRNVRDLLGFGDRTTADDLVRATATRRRTATQLDVAFGAADYLLLPGTGSRVPPLAAIAVEPEIPAEAYGAALAFTAPFNFSGHPTLSLPNGLDGDGLPFGLQLVARPFDEAGLLKVGYTAELSAPTLTRPYGPGA